MALSYELESLEELITENLHPEKLQEEHLITDQQFENWNQLLLQEKQTIRKRLKKVTFSYTKENHRKLYIQQHQFAITLLKNVLMEFLLPRNAENLTESNSDNKIAKLHKRCLATLQELLSSIKEEFPQYFNYEEKIPASNLLQLQDSLKTRLAKLRKQFVKTGQDAPLGELIIQTILLHCNNDTRQPLTYSRWEYIKELLNSLERMNPGDGYASHYPALIAQLVYMNFNATVFKNYFVKMIHAEINAGASLNDKIEIISFHHKEISQLPVKSGMALTSTLPSVQLDLGTWLFNEITHLEKKQTLRIAAPVQFKEPGDSEAEKGIYSQLTVEELGLFLKIQKDTDLLKNKNMKQVARSVAEHWHSKQKENISWQYLYNSMSTVEMGTIQSLEDKLVGLVNRLRKMRGRL
jgi:hypothetical protein